MADSLIEQSKRLGAKPPSALEDKSAQGMKDRSEYERGVRQAETAGRKQRSASRAMDRAFRRSLRQDNAIGALAILRGAKDAGLDMFGSGGIQSADAMKQNVIGTSSEHERKLGLTQDQPGPVEAADAMGQKVSANAAVSGNAAPATGPDTAPAGDPIPAPDDSIVDQAKPMSFLDTQQRDVKRKKFGDALTRGIEERMERGEAISSEEQANIEANAKELGISEQQLADFIGGIDTRPIQTAAEPSDEEKTKMESKRRLEEKYSASITDDEKDRLKAGFEYAKEGGEADQDIAQLRGLMGDKDSLALEVRKRKKQLILDEKKVDDIRREFDVSQESQKLRVEKRAKDLRKRLEFLDVEDQLTVHNSWENQRAREIAAANERISKTTQSYQPARGFKSDKSPLAGEAELARYVGIDYDWVGGVLTRTKDKDTHALAMAEDLAQNLALDKLERERKTREKASKELTL